MKKSLVFLFLSITILFESSKLDSQTPQYYNSSLAQGLSSYPFGIVGGKAAQWIILPHSINQPVPAPLGFIDTIFIKMGAAATVQFTNLTLKMAQTADTALPPGEIYPGVIDTVYFRPSVLLTSGYNTWMMIILDHPWFYDTSRSLVIDISQCGANGNSMYMMLTYANSNIRNFMNNGTNCNFVFSGQDEVLIDFGVNIQGLIGIRENGNAVPVSYTLEQNYPNPFNPVTKIVFDLPKSGNVQLIVSDVLGREVKQLVDEFKNAGSYTISFDASNMASGVYYYTIRVNEFSAVKKMVLIR